MKARGDPAGGVYVYCIIESREARSFGPIGLGGDAGEVYTINHADLAAVVSDVAANIVDLTEDNAFVHHRVISEVFNTFTVLPVSFGHVARSPDEVVSFLRDAYPQLKEGLAKLLNRVELGLKVFWKKESFASDVTDAQIDRLMEAIQSQRVENVQAAELELGRMVHDSAARKREEYKREIYGPLADHALQARLGDVISPRMVLNAAFLVDKSRQPDFDRRVRELQVIRGENLEFHYSGPWPAYNFADLQLPGH